MDKRTSYAGIAVTAMFAIWSFGNDLHQQYMGLSDYIFFVLLTLPLLVFGLPLIRQEDSASENALENDDEAKERALPMAQRGNIGVEQYSARPS